MRQPIKVALLTREFPPEVYGGAGVHVEYLSRALASRVELGVRCFGAPRDSDLVAGAYQPWEALPPERQGAVLRAVSVGLRMAADIEGIDLVHSHTWYVNLPGHLAKLLYDVPHVMTAHSLEPLRPWKAEQLGPGYALSLFCERTAIDAADAVIAVSRAMCDDVTRAYPEVDPERVHVIHNGIDTDEYRPDPATEVLERFGIDPALPSVMFVGRVTRQKGITYLLDAAELFDPRSQLILCAGAPDTPEIGAEMREQVTSLRERRRGVFWIEEMLSRREIVQLLSHAAVFVCPSLYEPFGLINGEAMACEVPVVATAVGGIPEIVEDGVTGVLVEFEPGDDPIGSPRDPVGFSKALARQVNRLLADPATAKRMGRAGRERVMKEFSWEAVADKTVSLYASLL
jgi:alpha-maltose-1-phosphate synthase